jgi:phage/conjugal plasmid C-4 type zinc finger TraR family protein
MAINAHLCTSKRPFRHGGRTEGTFGLRRSHLPPALPHGRLIPFLERYVATGWAGDNAVNEQIDATVKDGIRRAQSRLPQGKSLSECANCGVAIPEARRTAVPGVRLCIACQESDDRDSAHFSGYNRRGSKDSQLR